MFEMTPEERLEAFNRRAAVVRTRGSITSELLRHYAQPIRLHARLLHEFVRVLDYTKEVFCAACSRQDGNETVIAYPLLALRSKNPMADKGDMLSFTCLHCGFVEHHSEPPRERATSEMEMEMAYRVYRDYQQSQQSQLRQRQLDAIAAGVFPGLLDGPLQRQGR